MCPSLSPYPNARRQRLPRAPARPPQADSSPVSDITDTQGLAALAAHLHRRREQLLQHWRELIDLDPQLTSYKRIGRRTLDDHIPQALDNLEARMCAEHELAATHVEMQQLATAAEHATQRWQVGYHVREALREWGHLHQVLLSEITHYVAEHPEFDRPSLCAACAVLADLIGQSVSESGVRYFQFQQADATNRARALQNTIDELQKIENERAALLRETAHDLRGSAAVVANVSALLEKRDVDGPERQRFYGLLQRRVQSMGGLLTQLMVWARLETGEEALQLEEMNVAERIRAFCDLLRPIAEDRGLYLSVEAPTPLVVQTDPLQLQRIVQNLLLNAIRATEHGGITVRCEAEQDGSHWILLVRDTGPGFSLSERDTEKKAPDATRPLSSEAGAITFPENEGIGLMIVERLCESLKATMTVESAADHGTTIRITLPLRHSESNRHEMPAPK